MDLAIHPREHDLVIATHGRGALHPRRRPPAAGDVGGDAGGADPPLRDRRRAAAPAWPRPAASRFPGAGEFRGENQPYGALITYSLNVPGLPHPDEEKERERKEAEREEKAGKPPVADEPSEEEEPGRPGRPGRKKGPEAKIEILDESGKVIRTLQAPVTQGVNRAAWNLRRDAYKRIPRRDVNPFFEPTGPEVTPGHLPGAGLLQGPQVRRADGAGAPRSAP